MGHHSISKLIWQHGNILNTTDRVPTQVAKGLELISAGLNVSKRSEIESRQKYINISLIGEKWTASLKQELYFSSTFC